MMSSMTRFALFAPLFLATGVSAMAVQNWQQAPSPSTGIQPRINPQQPVRLPLAAAPSYGQSTDIDYALIAWKRLRQSEGYAFSDYARFVIANPGWPAESTLRRSAEKAMRPGEDPALVLNFFATTPPLTGNGWARLADAYAASGRTAEALTAGRSAWQSADLPAVDEIAIFSRFGSQLTFADHDQRIDALLFARRTSDAQRLLGSSTAARRPALAARIALQNRASDAETRYASVAGQVTSDAGLMMDRARYLRDSGYESAARQLMARPHAFTIRPTDPDRFYEMLVTLAKGAAADGQYQLSYDIARQVDDSLAPGTDITLKSYGVRDKYTTLTWLAGSTALYLRRPTQAVALFDRYARGGRSLQVATKGWYWAGRASAQAGQMVNATNYFSRAAATPELFYGQLSLERLGRPVPNPAPANLTLVAPAQRQAFQQKRIVRAIQRLGAQGRREDQSLFIRALSESVTTDQDRLLASELGTSIGRRDLAVWTARSARNSGRAFYTRVGFPTHSGGVPSGPLWSLVHGITRQESSFDRGAVSHAGARGLMQLMPATAQEQAGKMGVAYDYGRLTSDPAYNLMLGSAYFQRLVNQWDGNYPLAVASYNAGAGNVRKWVRAYGDPRQAGGDIVAWIERIPFEETRGYVQRVLENSVVYDTLNPTRSSPTPVHLSYYLGKSSRPG